jgi:hypothetical protein
MTAKPRPVYDESLDKLVFNLALLGLNSKDIAKSMGISVRTLYAWAKKYESFGDGMHNGKSNADSKVVAALYKKACEGNVSACIFWLCNRNSMQWKRGDAVDKRDDETEVKSINVTIQPKVEVPEILDDA